MCVLCPMQRSSYLPYPQISLQKGTALLLNRTTDQSEHTGAIHILIRSFRRTLVHFCLPLKRALLATGRDCLTSILHGSRSYVVSLSNVAFLVFGRWP